MTTEIRNIEERVKKAMEDRKYLFTAWGEDQAIMEVNAWYDDRLDDRDIAKIVESDDPEEMFYEILDDAWNDAVEREYQDIIESIENELKKEALCEEDDLHGLVDEYVRDHLCVNAPYSHYMAQMVKTTIVLDTGDANYDYSNNGSLPLDERSGLAWLASTQGYDLRTLNHALEQKDEALVQGMFLRSVYTEWNECPSSTPAVAFLVKMPLEKLIELNIWIRKQNRDGVHYDAAERPDCGTFHIGKETTTGLFDIITGGGSFLEIQLEKDIDIPIRYIRSATPDVNDCQGIRWCVGDAYGLCESAWKETAGKITAPTDDNH